MKKSTILAAVIIILVIVTIGIIVYTQFNHEIKVGNGYFSIPEGYSESTQNKDGDVTISNKTNSIYLSEIDKPLDECVNTYINSTKNSSRNATKDIINIDDVKLYKVSVSDGYTVHYWFTLDGKTFTIYSWDGNKNLDKDAIFLTTHAHT